MRGPLTGTKALDLAQPATGQEICTATGTDGETWYVARRRGGGTECTHRLEWHLSRIAPRGGFWHNVETELEPAGGDWVPGHHYPEEPAA